MMLKAVPQVSYASALAELTSHGWSIVSESASGAQLKAPAKMRALDKAALVLGVVVGALLHVLAGAFFIAIALIDYAFLTKPQTHFLAKDAPTLPPKP